ncbi:hypothetical protein [Parabacteroides sp.]
MLTMLQVAGYLIILLMKRLLPERNQSSEQFCQLKEISFTNSTPMP